MDNIIISQSQCQIPYNLPCEEIPATLVHLTDNLIRLVATWSRDAVGIPGKPVFMSVQFLNCNRKKAGEKGHWELRNANLLVKLLLGLKEITTICEEIGCIKGHHSAT